MSPAEHFETRSKKGRGRAQRSLDLIDAKLSQPITGRGVGYKLFAAGLSMAKSEMQRVYRLLRGRQPGRAGVIAACARPMEGRGGRAMTTVSPMAYVYDGREALGHVIALRQP
jgi:hypothetical protein